MTISGEMNFDFDKFAQLWPYRNCLKVALYETQNKPNSISRKIWVVQKFLNSLTVRMVPKILVGTPRKMIKGLPTHHSLKSLIIFKVVDGKSKCDTVWKLRKFTFTLFWQKFRENTFYYVEMLLKCWFHEFFLVRMNFSFFHTVCECVSFSWPTLSFIDVHFIKKNFFWKLFFIHEKESA